MLKFLLLSILFISYAVAMEEREQKLHVLCQKQIHSLVESNPQAVTHKKLLAWISTTCASLGLENDELQGYLDEYNYVSVFGSLCKGKRTEYPLATIHENENKLINLTKECLSSSVEEIKYDIALAKSHNTSCYKIHIMPKDRWEYQETVRQLIITLYYDPKFQACLSSFKLQPALDFAASLPDFAEFLEAKSAAGGVMPIIVIYPGNGKESAQYLLNALYELGKGMTGLCIIPRYSKPINGFLSYTQGNGDEKPLFPAYFNKKKVFYAPYFEYPEQASYYKLKNPTPGPTIPE